MDDFEEQNGDLSLDEEELGGVRYWSDFNRVYYVPRSVQKLSNAAEWETPDGDWGVGMESFKSYDKVRGCILWIKRDSEHGIWQDNDLMEGDVRLFVEECDSLQVWLCRPQLALMVNISREHKQSMTLSALEDS